jgi:hypothetical protein
MRWAGHIARLGEERGVYRFLVENPEGKRPLGRPRRRWEDNIRIDLQEVGCGVWTGLGWLRYRQVANTCECGKEISGSIKRGNFLTSCKPISFLGRTLLHGVNKYGRGLIRNSICSGVLCHVLIFTF